MPNFRKVFIASSSEAINIARIVGEIFTKERTTSLDIKLIPCIWEDVDWKINSSALDSLLEFQRKYDYGIFILTPDDKMLSRGSSSRRVRDNVIFEFALFLAQEDGKNKAFPIKPDNQELTLASDLAGITIPTYKDSTERDVLLGEIGVPVRRIIREILAYEKGKSLI